MLLVYQKTLVASAEAAPPAGKVLALLTSDVNVIGLMLPQIFQFIYVPLQLIGTTHLTPQLISHSPPLNPLISPQLKSTSTHLRSFSTLIP